MEGILGAPWSDTLESGQELARLVGKTANVHEELDNAHTKSGLPVDSDVLCDQ
jgi:hypothetical protein